MKKGKVFGKRQLVLAVMVVALGAAVWLNMQYSTATGGFLGKTSSSTSSSKNLGDTKFVNGTGDNGSVVQTSAGNSTYFTTAKADREKARNDAVALLEETANDVKASDEAKNAAIAKVAEIAARIEKEASIETIIKSKGFSEVVVMIGDKDINVVVKSDDLLASETLQIQDAVVSQTNATLDKIKIVTVK